MASTARATAPKDNARPALVPPILIGTAALILAGCMSGGGGLRPLPPVPTTTVTANTLPQPITFGQEPAIESQTLEDIAGTDPDAPLDGDLETALLESDPLPEPPGGASDVTEDDLIGAWSATTPAATCSINLSLTTWQGGYRASTRNCGDVQMAGLTAWSIEGRQVILRGTDGVTLGRLFRTGPTRYAGQLESGDALTLFR
jgi:hypothetical protein